MVETRQQKHNVANAREKRKANNKTNKPTTNNQKEQMLDQLPNQLLTRVMSILVRNYHHLLDPMVDTEKYKEMMRNQDMHTRKLQHNFLKKMGNGSLNTNVWERLRGCLFFS